MRAALDFSGEIPPQRVNDMLLGFKRVLIDILRKSAAQQPRVIVELKRSSEDAKCRARKWQSDLRSVAV